MKREGLGSQDPAYLPGTLHTQVLVRHGYRSAWVDEGIADLILELWKAGIDTIMSCQENHPGVMWIEFPAWAAQRFLKVAVPYEENPESLYWRAFSDRADSDDCWVWSVFAVDAELSRAMVYGSHPHERGEAEPEVLVGIRFPVTDHDELLGRVRRWNRENPANRTSVPIGLL